MNIFREALNLLTLDTHEVISNRKSGQGGIRDTALILQNMHTHPLGFVFEFKEVAQEAQLVKGVVQAFGQIKEKQHDTVVKHRNVRHIVHMGIAFDGEHARVGVAYM